MYSSSIISKDGYVVVDDSGLPQYDNSMWPWVNSNSSKNNTCDSVKYTTVSPINDIFTKYLVNNEITTFSLSTKMTTFVMFVVLL